ncbi:Dolichyl-phosphate-mannose-protein mannosyltransferase [Thermostaphylospora chromogena]|uniref:Dolichyl-phosphate-mannose-protein mannosyltransferase n=1 Tax=Thermostaphylospora chromogena TaxID=35622 RepID=A0A1H1D3M0_9ACTN|nr:Dolichyl-phosphate-mannose-protein mannosyltransferase [Thermostaphylospora chromogena]
MQQELSGEDPQQTATGVPPMIPAFGRVVSRNRLFAAIFVLAALLRLATVLGYRPAWVYWFDSFTYLNSAIELTPEKSWQPGGYPILLWLLRPLRSVAAVVVFQHALGLAIGVLVYLLLRRRGAPAWVATLAAVPQLCDASFFRLEHAVLSDTLFMFLMVAGVVTLLWRDEVTFRRGVCVGLLLGGAAIVRTIALPTVLVAVLWLVVRGAGWRPVLAAFIGAAVPLSAHGAWYAHHHGSFSLTGSGSGVLLWARTMTFADCDVIRPPAEEASLCPNGVTKDAASEYVWDPNSAINLFRGDEDTRDSLARSFAIRAILAQPLDYLHAVARDTSIAFAWTPIAHPKRTTPAYGFAKGVWPVPDNPLLEKIQQRYDPRVGVLRSVDPYAQLIVWYQYVGYLHGPLKLLIVLLGFAAVWRRPRTAVLPWLTGMFLLVGPVAVLDFDHRYVLPAIPLLSLAAGALAARR